MCHLILSPADTSPTEMQLLNAGQSNPDGYGWAAVIDGEIVMHKTMNLRESVDSFLEARKLHPSVPMLWHARWATHGTTNEYNVHPFYVGRDKKTVLAHNGVLGEPARPDKDDNRSDTHKFAQSILPGWGHLDQEGVQRKVSGFCGNSNKLVILTANTEKYAKSVYLVNGSLGQWDKDTGCWHSNSDHKYARYGRGASFHSGMYAGMGWEDWDDYPVIGRPTASSSWVGGGYAATRSGVVLNKSTGELNDIEDRIRAIREQSSGKSVVPYGDGTLFSDHGSTAPGRRAKRKPQLCLVCKGEDLFEDYCLDCGLCQGCGGDLIDGSCQCWLPESIKKQAKNKSEAKWWEAQEA